MLNLRKKTGIRLMARPKSICQVEKKLNSLIPAAQGTKTRYTVTYTDGVDNEEVFKDKVFENIVTGSKTPDFGEIPVRDGYTFKGWSPQIEDTVTKTVVYNATWDMNLIDLNIAPTITATDKSTDCR